MSDDSETVEDRKKGSLAEVTDDLCTVEFIEIDPLDRPSDDYHTSEFIDPVVEVKPEDLQEMKQEPSDENDNVGYGVVVSCFTIEVSSFMCMLHLFLHVICRGSSVFAHIIASVLFTFTLRPEGPVAPTKLNSVLS